MNSAANDPGGSPQSVKPNVKEEDKGTHIFFSLDGVGIATVRKEHLGVEYADGFRKVLADAISDKTTDQQNLTNNERT